MTAIDSASLESFERLADIGAWLVIVGVIGEGLEIALKLCDHKCKNKKFLEWYKRHDFCIEIWGGIFWIIVVVGLLMELRYSGKAQLLVKKENTRITQEASDARTIAGKSELEAGQANERAAKFDADRVMVEKEAEEIRGANFALQTELLKLKAKTQDRTISDALKFSIRGVLTNLSKGEVQIMAFQSDREAVAFGKQLNDDLIWAGFASSFTASQALNGTYIGLVFIVNDPNHPPEYAKALLSVLRSNSIVADGWLYDSSLKTNALNIAVFPKPPVGDE